MFWNKYSSHVVQCQSWNDPNSGRRKKFNFYLKLFINILSDIIYSKLICCPSNSYFINLKNLVIRTSHLMSPREIVDISIIFLMQSVQNEFNNIPAKF